MVRAVEKTKAAGTTKAPTAAALRKQIAALQTQLAKADKRQSAPKAVKARKTAATAVLTKTKPAQAGVAKPTTAATKANLTLAKPWDTVKPQAPAVPNVDGWRVGHSRDHDAHDAFWRTSAVNTLYYYLPDCSGLTNHSDLRLRRVARVIETARSLSAMAGCFMTRQQQLCDSLKQGSWSQNWTSTQDVMHPRELEPALDKALAAYGVKSATLVDFMQRELIATQLPAYIKGTDVLSRFDTACVMWNGRKENAAYQEAVRCQPLRRLEDSSGVAFLMVRNGKVAIDYTRKPDPVRINVQQATAAADSDFFGSTVRPAARHEVGSSGWVHTLDDTKPLTGAAAQSAARDVCDAFLAHYRRQGIHSLTIGRQVSVLRGAVGGGVYAVVINGSETGRLSLSTATSHVSGATTRGMAQQIEMAIIDYLRG